MEKHEERKLHYLLIGLSTAKTNEDSKRQWKEILAYIDYELDKAREDVLIELQKEFSEFGVPDDVRYTQPLFYINEVIEKKLSKLKTKEDGK
ncbi:MAG: hypothetical protein WCY37_04960 [Candidatus Dojkabacteria bacterium]